MDKHMAREMTPQERAAIQSFYYRLHAGVEGGEFQERYEQEDIGRIIELLDETRRAALLEAAQQVCMHCGKRAIGLQVGVNGPNAAGNYVHNPPEDSRVKESVRCSATSIWSLIRYEDRLAQEGS